MEKATKEAERDEIQGFYAAVKEFAGAVKKMKESQTERDDAIKSIFGVKDASKVSTKAREAFMSNDREQMMRLIEGARTKKEKGILEHALAQMTAYSAEKLKELVDTATASEKTMARSKREYEAEIASDSRLKAFVDAKGLQANEATIVGASKSVETEIKGLNREIRDLGETISRLGYEAVKRARTGGQTEEDRKRLKAAAESKK